MSICTCPDRDGLSSNTYISTIFKVCVYTPKELVSFIFGWISIGCWCIALYPGVRLNFLMKDADSISPVFIFIWLISDSFNLISVILLNELFTQIVLAVIWLFLSIVTFAQIVLYTTRKHKIYRSAGIFVPKLSCKGLFKSESADYTNEGRIKRREALSGYEKKSNDLNVYSYEEKVKILKKKAYYRPWEILLYVVLFFFVVSNLVWYGRSGDIAIRANFNEVTTCSIPVSPSSDSARYIVGSVLGYTAHVLNILSRIPQIYRTICKKDVTGLSFAMFFIMCFANVVQFISLVTNSQEKDYLVSQIPYIIGACGPALEDCFSMCLHCFYTKKNKSKAASSDENKPFDLDKGSETELIAGDTDASMSQEDVIERQQLIA